MLGDLREAVALRIIGIEERIAPVKIEKTLMHVHPAARRAR